MIFLYGIPEIIQFAEDVFVFDVAAGVPSQRGSANAAGQAAHVPAEVIHLQSTGGQIPLQHLCHQPSTPHSQYLFLPPAQTRLKTTCTTNHRKFTSEAKHFFFLQNCMHSKG